MKHVNSDDPFAGPEQMVRELGDLLGGLTQCLAHGLQAFLKASGVGGTRSGAIRFQCATLEAVRVALPLR